MRKRGLKGSGRKRKEKALQVWWGGPYCSRWQKPKPKPEPNMKTSPEEYALAKGWDFTQIADTARRGVSQHDIEALGFDDSKILLEWCQDVVLVTLADRVDADVVCNGSDVAFLRRHYDDDGRQVVRFKPDPGWFQPRAWWMQADAKCVSANIY